MALPISHHFEARPAAKIADSSHIFLPFVSSHFPFQPISIASMGIP